MKRSLLMIVLVTCFVFLASNGFAGSQKLKPVLNLAETGEIRGVFEYCGPEGSGGVLAYIPGMSFMLKTGKSGMFIFQNVPPATYNITFEVPGKAAYILEKVTVKKRMTTDLGTVTYCPDNDGDGFSADYDCNDNDMNVFPGAPELCDSVDNNCDGVVDEGCQACTDLDGDDYFAQPGCGSLVDCDDTDGTINPGAPEICGDNRDNNCMNGIDEGCAVDNDGDGFSEPEDCNDADPAVNPSAQELCDGVDNDCDGSIDEGLIPTPGICIGAQAVCLGSSGWVCY